MSAQDGMIHTFCLICNDACTQIPLDTSKDMYVHQFEEFLQAVRTGDESYIRCPYQTAALTYQASQWITIAANKNRAVGPWSK